MFLCKNDYLSSYIDTAEFLLLHRPSVMAKSKLERGIHAHPAASRARQLSFVSAAERSTVLRAHNTAIKAVFVWFDCATLLVTRILNAKYILARPFRRRLFQS